jgi:hypothetical protein
VDSNHPDGIVQDFSHLPLAQEEKIRARVAELDHISAQAELGIQDGRAKRTREVVTERRQCKREKRTPGRTDPRERLSRTELAKVNQEPDRIVQRLRTDHGRRAVSRALAKRVARGQDITEAVFATMDELKAAPGAICPIEDVQTESSGNQCPECNGHVTTNVKETICEDCGLVIEEQRLDHGPEWRAYDADERERTGAPLTAALTIEVFDGDRPRNRCARERTLRPETPAAGPDAT